MSTKTYQVKGFTLIRRLVKAKPYGFTLIELLIAVTIIAILISIGTASFLKAQSQARDARRLADLSDIQSALEQYYSENGIYPPSGSCPNTPPWCFSIDPQPWILDTDIYLSGGLSIDPKNDWPYVYLYAAANEGSTYVLLAATENNRVEPSDSLSGYFDIAPGGSIDQVIDCHQGFYGGSADCVIFHGPVTD